MAHSPRRPRTRTPLLSATDASRRIAVATAVGAASLACATGASAATYCVSDVACAKGGGKVEPTITAALADANSTPAADVVKIGSGTFKGNFDNGAATSPVQIVGDGQGKTILTAEFSGAGSAYPKILTLRASAADPASVRDLTMTLAGAGARGLELDGGATATRVDLTGTGTSDAIGVIASPGTYDGGTTTLTGSTDQGVSLETAGSVVRNAQIKATIGISSDTVAGSALVQRSRITTSKTGAWLMSGTLRLEDSLVDGRTGTDGRLVQVFTTNSSMGQTRLFLANDTIVGNPASSTQIGLDVEANAAKDNMLATVTDSVFTGLAFSAHRQASAGFAAVTFDHSAHGPLDSLNFGTGTGTFSETAALGNPPSLGFVDAANGDFHLAAGSPLIDAGTPGPLSGAEGALDLDNLPRLADGDQDGILRRDVGAYERAGKAVLSDPPKDPVAVNGGVTPTTGDSPAAGGTSDPGGANPSNTGDVNHPALDATAPHLTKLKVLRGTGSKAARRRSTLTFSLDETAALTVTASRRTGKRWTAVKGSISLAGKLGANGAVLPKKLGGKALKPGSYRLVIVARDAAGNAAPSSTVTFKVSAR